MKQLIALIMLIAHLTFASETKFDPYKGSKPLVVIIDENPWLMVIDSDNPILAIYEDGTVIYANESRAKYLTVKLENESLRSILKSIEAFGIMDEKKNAYDLAEGITDQPTTSIYLCIGNKERHISIYGLSKYGKYSNDNSKDQFEKQISKLPEKLGKAVAYLFKQRFETSNDWFPKYIEVMIWPYEYAPEESVNWPKDWPRLNSVTTLKRGTGFSIYLDAKMEPKLIEILKKRKEKGAVQIDGKKWAVSYRPVFQSEPIWRGK